MLYAGGAAWCRSHTASGSSLFFLIHVLLFAKIFYQSLLADLYHTIHDICLISHTGVKRVLDLIQTELMRHDIPDTDPAGGYGFDRLGIDVAVTEL